eukprot:c19192_g1_i1 orf=172-2352(+)
MDAHSFRRVEPPCMHYALKAQSPRIHYFSSFVKPFNWRSDLHKTPKACISRGNSSSSSSSLPKLKIVSELLENEATRSGTIEQEHASTNSENINNVDAPPMTKVNGKINYINGGINAKANIKSSLVNGNGGVISEQRLAEQMIMQGEKGAENLLSQANSNGKGSSTSVSKEELIKLEDGYQSSTIEDADINSYRKFMQGLYLQHSPPASIKEGLGIVEFLKGKNLFITGATGFLAKVLVERVLQVQPNVGQLFLLIQAKDVHHAKKRLREEIMHCHLFKELKSFHGDSYQKFMERKLFPIVGNIATDHLGMDVQTMDVVQKQVDIIVNSAASTTFDERYDHALNLNTKGAQRIVQFGKGCPHLELLMHVSTAFVNGERRGVVKEKAFKIGCSIANEALKKEEDIAPDIDVDMESSIIQNKMDDVLMNDDQRNVSLPVSHLTDQYKEKQLQQAMKDLGMERAKSFGWQDTYVFTKAMGEMLVDSTRGQIPVVIVRPSVVESSFRDPFPGWMEGNRMMDPIIISYGKGQLPGFLVNPRSVLDVVPVDMVANAMLAAMARHARKPGLEVYQVASSVVNPLVFAELARMSEEHFTEQPFMDNVGKPITTPTLQLFQDIDSFMHAVSSCSSILKEKIPSTSNVQSLLKRHEQLTLKVKQQAAYLANLYRPYTFYAGRFDTSNTQRLFESLSCQEKELFGFDVSKIDWDTYIKRIHIPGIRKHVLKGRGSSV